MTNLTPHHLSGGFLERVMNGEEVEVQPIFQILAIKKLTNFSKIVDDTDRYRLKLSDGQTLNSFIMLAISLNHMIYSNILTEYSIVKISKYAISKVKNNGQDRSIMIILNMDVVVPGYQVGKILGSASVSFIEEKLQNIDISD